MANRSRTVMTLLAGSTLFAACAGAPATPRQRPADHARVSTLDGGPGAVLESPAPADSIEAASDGEHLRDFDESDTITCAARAAGNVDCWGPEARRWPREAPPARSIATPGPVDHLFLDGDSLCVITTDRAMHCASSVGGDDPPPTWELMAQGVVDSDHGDGWWCVIAGPERHVYCGGEVQVALPPQALPFDRRRAQAIDGAPVSAQSLAMGERHVCVILADGGIACMGDGAGGQLGLGAGELVATSLRVIPGQPQARTVVATRSRSCALDTMGTVRCWGDSSAYHPVAMAEGVSRLSRRGHSICVGGDELDCGLSRVRLHPWNERPPLSPGAAGALRGHSWSRGHTHMLCEHVGDTSRVAPCYTDLPTDVGASRASGAPPDWQEDWPATLDDLPPYPMRPAASARIYQVTSGRSSYGDCDDLRVSRVAWEEDEACPDLQRRGQPIPARALRRIKRALNDPRAYEAAVTCFVPHHEIIFFDAQEQPVARLVLSLSCGTMETFPTAPLQAVFGTILPRGLNLTALCRSTGIGGCLDE